MHSSRLSPGSHARSAEPPSDPRAGLLWWRLLACLSAAAVLAVAAAGAGVARAQRSDPDRRGTIRSEVSLVNILSSVLYQDGRPAVDLQQDRFEIFEEGVQQKIEVFEAETTQPLQLALMIDTSMSQSDHLAFEVQAASRFIQKLVRPEDRLGIFEFSDTVTQIAPYSSNVPGLQAALKSVRPGEGTALYDAVYLGARSVAASAPGRRRVIVLMTDAGETTSRADFESVRRATLRGDVLLYTIVLRPVRTESGRYTAGEHALETVADSTGGAIYFPAGPVALDQAFSRIDRELRTQYRLGYYPAPRPPAGQYRSIEVRAKCDCTVRSRKSYLSGGSPD